MKLVNNIIDRIAGCVADKVAEMVAGRLAAEIPRIVESVAKAVITELGGVAKDAPRGWADAVLKVLGR